MLRIDAITLDCRGEAATLAGFWSELLDRPVAAGASAYFAQIDPAGDQPRLMFIAAGPRHPGKNPIHLDLRDTADLADAVARAERLGAVRVGDFAEHGFTWTTLRDPEGNLFDIGTPH
ncbi:VOC family protein [Granulicoccus phenolivorans]|uniref:VOC family protein n=1 Tax=Granulicoccus phenolivorans TaxID=266854 RepID=UPI00040DF3C9|nr:VOC family protein [Granulicoccus phenolivorans]